MRGGDNRQGSSVFEYGSCLKAFPDEPIQVLTRDEPAESGNFFQNW
jgi:hypothetical protein